MIARDVLMGCLATDADGSLLCLRRDEPEDALGFLLETVAVGALQRSKRREANIGRAVAAGQLPRSGDEAVEQEGGTDVCVLREHRRAVAFGDDPVAMAGGVG